MADVTNDAELSTLLRVIDGTDYPYTTGFRTFPAATPHWQQRLHAACLALEQRGLIHRQHEDPVAGMVVWMPTETAVAP
jgi:hypothetical protein